MGQELSELEDIIEGPLEPDLEEETFNGNRYEIEFGEHYFVDPEKIEIDEGIRNEQERQPENQKNHYCIEPHQLEIQEAIKEVQEPVDEQPSAVTLWILRKKENL